MSYCASRVDFSDLILDLLDKGFSIEFSPAGKGSNRWAKIKRNEVEVIAVGKPLDALQHCVEKWKRDSGVV